MVNSCPEGNAGCCMFFFLLAIRSTLFLLVCTESLFDSSFDLFFSVEILVQWTYNYWMSLGQFKVGAVPSVLAACDRLHSCTHFWNHWIHVAIYHWTLKSHVKHCFWFIHLKIISMKSQELPCLCIFSIVLRENHLPHRCVFNTMYNWKIGGINDFFVFHDQRIRV